MGSRVITWRGMIFIVVLLLVIFGCVMYGIFSSRAAMELQADAYQEEIISQENILAELKSNLARVGSDAYVENEAREKYNYVYPGEVQFAFSNPDMLDYYTDAEWQIIMEEGLYQ